MDGLFSLLPNVEVPEMPAMESPFQRIWSDEQFEILKKYITSFEESLDNEHEVGVLLTNFGQSVLMQVTSVTYEFPVILIFKGFVNGREATLIQHVNQLNFLLTSMEREDDKPKNRIGFYVEKSGE